MSEFMGLIVGNYEAKVCVIEKQQIKLYLHIEEST